MKLTLLIIIISIASWITKNKRNKKDLLSAEEEFEIFQKAKRNRDSIIKETKFECENCGAHLRAEFAECDYCGMISKPKIDLVSKEDINYV